MVRLFVFIAVMLAVQVSAQELKEKSIANVELTVSYSYDQLCCYTDKEGGRDWRVSSTVWLEVGDGIAHSYVESEHNKMVKSLSRFQSKNHWMLEINLHALLGETLSGYPQAGKLTQLVDLDVAGVYQYTEKIPKIRWTLGQERKTVLGYDCQQATCRFRGRDYVAWFAADIPLSYGPWKFHGLPGLILEVSDTQCEYVFTATGIEKPKTETSIRWIDEESIREIKREQALKMEKMLHKDHGACAADFGVTFMMGGMEHASLPYNPIELE